MSKHLPLVAIDGVNNIPFHPDMYHHEHIPTSHLSPTVL